MEQWLGRNLVSLHGLTAESIEINDLYGINFTVARKYLVQQDRIREALVEALNVVMMNVEGAAAHGDSIEFLSREVEQFRAALRLAAGDA